MDGYQAGQDFNFQRATRALGDVASARPNIEQPALEVCLVGLSKELVMIQENVSRLDAFKNRLLNPRPARVPEQAADAPTQGTVEGRLQHLIYTTHAIGEHLHEIANDLDRAA